MLFSGLGGTIATNLHSWPSSTGAELVVILLALLVTLHNNSITIFTDSQAAITAIENMSTPKQISPREILKSTNNLVLLKIKTLIQYKQLSLILIKVKAHLGIDGNEKADAAAKGSYFNNTVNNLDSFCSYFLMFAEIPIERKL